MGGSSARNPGEERTEQGLALRLLRGPEEGTDLAAFGAPGVCLCPQEDKL